MSRTIKLNVVKIHRVYLFADERADKCELEAGICNIGCELDRDHLNKEGTTKRSNDSNWNGNYSQYDVLPRHLITILQRIIHAQCHSNACIVCIRKIHW